MSKAKKKIKPYDSTPAKRHTLGKSYNEEADRDFREGIANIKKFEHPSFGGLSLYLRKAARYFKMAADRFDHADGLLGNTLEKYVKEDEKT